MWEPPVCLATGNSYCDLCGRRQVDYTVKLNNQDTVTFDVVVKSLSLAKIPTSPQYAYEHVLRRQTLRQLSIALTTETKISWSLAAAHAAKWYIRLEAHINTYAGVPKQRGLIRKQLLYNLFTTINKYLKETHIACQLSSYEAEALDFLRVFDIN